MMNQDGSDNGGNGQTQHEQDSVKPKYTIPGILHFIQHEWSRCEMERSQWDVERSELQARIAFLEGERKGQENLKRDLIRRIKMLEYALRQERARFHKLKYGTDLVLDIRSKDSNMPDDLKSGSEDQQQQQNDNNSEDILLNNHNQQQQQQQQMNNHNSSLKHGRQLLRQYLQEVGYSETILDVRSQRVRALLLNNSSLSQLNTASSGGGVHHDHHASMQLINGLKNIDKNKKNAGQQQQQQSPQGGAFITEANGRATDDDDAVATTTENNNDDLQQQYENHEEHDMECEEQSLEDDNSNSAEQQEGSEQQQQGVEEEGTNRGEDKEQVDDDDDDPEGVMSQFDFLASSDLDGFDEGGDEGENTVKDWPVDQDKIEAMKEQFQKEKRTNKKKSSKRPDKKDLQNMLENLKGIDTSSSGAGSPGGAIVTSHSGNNTSSSSADNPSNPSNDEDNLPFTVGGARMRNDESIENALGLGDLAGLTVANEADILCLNVSSSTKEPFRKMWSPKYTLRSHFDGVRGVSFLPNACGLVTASEDQTLKLWNLNKTGGGGGGGSKRSSSLDLDPIYTFRGHTGGVLCCEMGKEGEVCYSGGMDASIRCWQIPSITGDPYENYDPCVSGKVLAGHTDAVWSLSYSSNSTRRHLLSAASDMTIRLWNPQSANEPLLQTYTVNSSGAPTCVEFVRCDCNRAVASHADGKIVVYDLESGKTPVILQDSGDAEDRVNCVVSHPTMPITISAHDDRQIKFFDNTSGKKIHQMVAHLDVVTSLAIDPNGLYLLSGSHDCSIRLWNVDTKTCIQELTSHRKKFDESIYSVAFHPNATFIASAGADAMVKVFE